MRAPTAAEWERMSWRARQQWQRRQSPSRPDPIQRPEPLSVIRTRGLTIVTDGICTAYSARRPVVLEFLSTLGRTA